MRQGLALAVACLPAWLAGCAELGPVEPWEKGHLARPAMRFDGDRLETGYAEHIYFSKEAASGGSSVGGGGCGCN